MGLIRKRDEVIDSLEAWKRLASPKSPVQWQDGGSAKESARAWLRGLAEGRVPQEVGQILRSHQHFGEILEWEIEPESLVVFDNRSGPAHIDVLLRAVTPPANSWWLWRPKPTRASGRHPTFGLKRLRDDAAFGHFTETMEWCFGEIENAVVGPST